MSFGGRVVIGLTVMPRCRQSDMISASGTFCQNIHRHEWCSTYQPSREAEMLSANSRFRAYSAMPKAQYLGGMLSNTKLRVSGMKKPDAKPLKNCIVNNVGKLGEKGVRREIKAK